MKIAVGSDHGGFALNAVVILFSTYSKSKNIGIYFIFVQEQRNGFSSSLYISYIIPIK